MDWTQPFHKPEDFPVLDTETVPVSEIKVGEWVIRANSALVPFYRLVIDNRDGLTFHKSRWIGGPDKRNPGHVGSWCTIPNGGDGIRWSYEGATIERVTNIPDGIHLMYASKLARGAHHELDRLVDGRIAWDVAKHVHSSGDLMVRFEKDDEFTQVPLGSIALVRSSHRD